MTASISCKQIFFQIFQNKKSFFFSPSISYLCIKSSNCNSMSNPQQPSVVRIGPIQYIHVLDNNTNLTHTVCGPRTYTLQGHETLVAGPTEMVIIPPRHYCVVEDPVKRDEHGDLCLHKGVQAKLRLGDYEYRFAQPPFPLYPGERQVGKILPLRTLAPNTALQLIALRDFDDATGGGEAVHRYAGEEWLFKGPGTYIPRTEVGIKGLVNATIVRKEEALHLRALRLTKDYEGNVRQCDEGWLMRRPGAYIPSVDEVVVGVVTPRLLSPTTALWLRAKKQFCDVYGKKRRVGDEWLVTYADASSHLVDVCEEEVTMVKAHVLLENDYCVIVNPVGADGKPQFGKKLIRTGKCCFFLNPGESLLDNKVKHAFILSAEEGLLLRALEPVDGHHPGDRWMVTGPATYIPPVEVEVLEKRRIIPLDKDEGVYVREIRTGRVREQMGEMSGSYMLKANEELCEKELPDVVERLLTKDVRVTSGSSAADAVPARDKTRVVSLRLPFNSACQVYDFKENRARVVLGPSLVKLGYNEQFTVLSLSGGNPKVNHQIDTIVLLLGPDFMSDTISVDTSDHAKLQIKVSYNYRFVPDPEHLERLFVHPDFVGDVCKTMASKIRSAVVVKPFDEFHRNSAEIIRRAVFGDKDVAAFENNSLVITDVDIQSVALEDQKTRDSLMKSVQLAIQITTQSQEALAEYKAREEDHRSSIEVEKLKLVSSKEFEEKRAKLLTLRAENRKIETGGRKEAEVSAGIESGKIEAETAAKEAELHKQAKQTIVKKDFELKRQELERSVAQRKTESELELDLKRQLACIEAEKFEKMVQALGPEVIKAIAKAGPQQQADLLKGLGLKSVLLTDGSAPINLFNAAKGMIAQPPAKKASIEGF